MALSKKMKIRAANELKRLLNAESDLYEFMRYMIPNFIEAEHLKTICSKLKDVAEGRCKRLIVVTPPRHGKSETTSINFPAWYLGNHPQEQIIACSYSADLATTFSEATRRVIQSKRYQRI
ncbi:terminase, partial [Candidatus Nomurabacteria bacterium]|nr:terminase [Candidatus Nomurabacteria bacterium]